MGSVNAVVWGVPVAPTVKTIAICQRNASILALPMGCACLEIAHVIWVGAVRIVHRASAQSRVVDMAIAT